MKKRILALAAAVMMLFLTACSGDSIVKVDCGAFTVDCPRSWKMNIAEDSTSGEPFAQIYLPEQGNYTSNIVFSVQAVAGLKAEDFNESYAQNLVDSSIAATDVAFTLEACEHTTLGSRAAVIIRYTGVKDGRNVVVSEQLIPTEEVLYRLTFTCLNDADADAMNAAIASVSFK